MPLNILYEDQALIVLNKSAGQIVIPGRGRDEGEPLVFQVEQYLRSKAYVVHRLDKESSRVLLFAKDAAAHRTLNLQFERRKVQKIYHAVVQGKVGVIDRPIRQFGSGRMGVAPHGQAAVTHYRILERWQQSTLLEVQPKTGRRHQIRVHLYAVGHPVLGDPLYGQNRLVGGIARLMLHAYSITFRHPSGEMVTFQVEPGEDWENVINHLKRHISLDSSAR